MSAAHLEWWYPLGGGLLIGLSAGLYLLFNGRVTGVSGMASVALGLARASSRILPTLFLAATGIFMVMAGITVFLMRHVFGATS